MLKIIRPVLVIKRHNEIQDLVSTEKVERIRIYLFNKFPSFILFLFVLYSLHVNNLHDIFFIADSILKQKCKKRF